MEFAIFRCCPTNSLLHQYESSTDALLGKLDVGFVDIKEFNCCGYPLKNFNFKAYLLSSARNLSLSEKRNLNIMTVCNCCYGTLKHVDHIMKEDAAIRKEINDILKKEGLSYGGNVEVKHLLEVLYEDIGTDHIREKLASTFEGLRVAIHYGCHILRPRQIVQFENPGSSVVFDQLVEITGAENISWATQSECCGSPIWGTNDELSMDLTEKKIIDAKQSGADYLCVSCPFCQLQFDKVQKMLLSKRSLKQHLPSILVTQLLGLSLGIDGAVLGIDQNELDMNSIVNFLQQPVRGLAHKT